MTSSPSSSTSREETEATAGSSAREPRFSFDNSYARLPDTFYARVAPTSVSKPLLIRVNRPLAAELGLDPDALSSPNGVAILSGNRLPEGADAIALAYAGHQFGHWVPVLGDGRAILLGEIRGRDGVRRDVQLKGAGRTPFSRMGDGRAGLGPVLREYIVSEAMAGLGIPTTRALAMVSTGELVPRPQRTEPGAVLTRIATAHVRVGTFEYFARSGDLPSLRRLADYVIERLYADAACAGNPYRALLEAVILRQADLIAQWMLVGFIHGVMNTDNMSIAGETIDYGPCAFMDTYHPATVYSSIDHGGRYAYHQQPRIGHWNLARFAETLLPLLAADEDQAIEVAHAALANYPPRFEASYLAGLRRKLGLYDPQADDASLAERLLEQMAEQRADFTLTFRALCDVTLDDDSTSNGALRAQLPRREDTDAWLHDWRTRVASEGRDPALRRRDMRAVNPAFIPRNHRVQQAIDAAVEAQDLAPLEALLAVTTRPYDDHPESAEYAHPPEPHEVVHQTFCGT